MEDQEKLIKLYKEYMDLLEEEIDELVPLASVHGWKTSRFERGSALRKKIKELEELQNS